jgi:pyruvate, water dikinase
MKSLLCMGFNRGNCPPDRTTVAKASKIGMCGQASSYYPAFARFLVEQGIDSISLNPDSVIKTRLEIAQVEASL